MEPVEELSQASVAMIKQVECESSVAVHVRRGDYVSRAAAAKWHGALPLSYYSAAFAHVREHVREPQFFVFSDDPDWCRANLPLSENESTFVTFNAGTDACRIWC